MKRVFLKSISIVTVLTIISKLLGFVREAFIASYFGTSIEADAYFIASLIPMMIFSVIGTAISTGIIPLYIKEKKKNQEKANEAIGIIATFFTGLSMVISLLIWIFALDITELVAPGFSSEQIDLTVYLVRIMIFASAFFVLSAFATGVLHANKKFLTPAAVSAVNNMIIILSMVTLAQKFGISGLAIGTMIGISSQFFIQYPQFKMYNIKPNFRFSQYKTELKAYLFIILPIILSSLMSQMNKVVDRVIASDLPVGSISALNYANKLLYLPISIIIMTFVTVLYPYLIDALERSKEEFMELALRGLRIITYVSIPFLVVMLVLKNELVSMAFGRGEFTIEAETMTSSAFFYYTLGMIFIASKSFLFQCFYALRRVNITIITSTIFVIVNIILSIMLSKHLAHGGIALATSIAMLLHTIILVCLLFLISKEGKLLREFLTDIGKMFLLFALLVFISSYVMELFTRSHIIMICLNTLITFSLFFLLSLFLKIKEMQYVITMVKKKAAI